MRRNTLLLWEEKEDGECDSDGTRGEWVWTAFGRIARRDGDRLQEGRVLEKG